MIILDVLKNQTPFLISLVIGVVAHTIGGAMKHEKIKDFDWNALLKGAIKFGGIILVIELVMIGINVYEPLYTKFAEEMKMLEELIVLGVYAKVIVLIKEYFDVKEQDNTHEVA